MTQGTKKLVNHRKAALSVMFYGNVKGCVLSHYLLIKLTHVHDQCIAGGPIKSLYNNTKSE